jgi:glycerol-3-phosphate cytidylyltransferase
MVLEQAEKLLLDERPQTADRTSSREDGLKKVATYGTFDLFHIGHLRLLERLRSLGDHLTVFVSTDEFNDIKGKLSAIAYPERAAIVAALRCVDAVFPEWDWDQKIADIAAHEIDVFGMGDDWAGHFDFLKSRCEVVYLPRTPGVSSTRLRNQASCGEAGEIVEVVRAPARRSPTDERAR